MSDKPKLDEGTLREVKDDLMERLSDQQRQVGVIPRPDLSEKFIDPIIRKVEVDHELERQKAIVRAEAGINDLPDGGDGKILPTGRRRMRRAPLAGAPGVASGGRVARFAINVGDEMKEQAQLATLQRMMVKHLLELPDWKPRLLKAVKACGKHDGTIVPADQHCMDCTMRERKLQEILAQAVRYFGDPKTPATSKAFSMPGWNPLTPRTAA